MAGRISIPPNRNMLEKKDPQLDLWFKEVNNRMNVYKGTSNPTASVCPEGQWIIFNNTSLSEIRIWTNVAGVMKKSAAFT